MMTDEELDALVDDGDDYIRCVSRADATHTTWCKRPVAEVGFKFEDAGHALLAVEQGSRLVICPECQAAMLAVLEASE